jgi:citrate synthase
VVIGGNLADVSTLINVDSTINDASKSPQGGPQEDGRRLSAARAAAYLGVKRETLYAYASRGLVRSVGGPRGKGREYLLSDLDRVKARRDARAGHGPVAAGALLWGEPVLDSAVTGIDERGPRYRGVLATELAAAGAPFESVAALLWTAVQPASPPRWIAKPVPDRARRLPAGPPIATLSAVLPLAALHDRARHGAAAADELARAEGIIAMLAGAWGPAGEASRSPKGWAVTTTTRGPAPPRVAARIARALGLGKGPRVRAAIDVALVLVADHELNASSFAARIAASSGADLYACLGAALATLGGPRHGGACDRVEALISEIGEPRSAQGILREHARRGEGIAGFGHTLYPKGDPRARPLLDLAARLAPKNRDVRIALALERAMARTQREPATIDLGLVSLAAAIGAPPGSAALLFALGRSAGWVAHILEQRESHALLRPRARYVGV